MDLDRDNPLAIEIQQEVAQAYFAACRKMVDALEALKAFDNSADSRALTGQQAGRRLELIEEAAERVYFVLIQRESIKLSGGDVFFETYDVPVEVRARLGPKRRKTTD